MHGRGILTFGKNSEWSGDKYNGEFKEDLEHRQGIWTHPNGEKYEGEHKDGKRHGTGIYTWPDGREETGRWFNDQYIGI